ncbi:MAG: APC family permease [Armatimonadetes bacterium]|nr:APC family permease [Armatimonadota bacterium]
MAAQASTSSLRRFLLGPPLATSEVPRQTVGKVVGLAVFASDAMSSVAYATEEILFILAVAGAAYFGLSIPIAMAISALPVVLTVSSRQTIVAYPCGGGASIVARDNLGESAAQTAGAALLTDYILTVSVSIASGVAQIVSAFPALAPWRVQLAVGAIFLMMLINLRGVRESGTFFAFPAYYFILMMLGMLALGFYRLATGTLPQVSGVRMEIEASQPLTLFLALRAFSSGSVAVTGTEAISNGITAFREPKSRNAAATMAWMAALLGVMFLSITVLANRMHALPSDHETVISQLARTIYGPGGLYLLTLAATSIILILAANTSFADFPRLAALHAGDGFLPRQLTYRGSRLVFSWGIVVLAGLASLLVVAFSARVTQLIPLYAIGVFLSFTMSQAGMVVRWRKVGRLRPGEEVETHGTVLRHEPRWRVKQAVNAVGATLTTAVMLVLAVTKFTQGAWIVVIVIPGLVWVFFRIHHHYQAVRHQLSASAVRIPFEPAPVLHVVLISDMHAANLRQIRFARSLGGQWWGVHVAVDEQKAAEVQRKWEQYVPDGRLVVLLSPYRDLVTPIREYLENLRARHPDAYIHVIMGQIIMDNFLEQALHHNSSVIFKLALQDIPRVVATDVAYPVHTHDDTPPAAAPSADQAEPADHQEMPPASRPEGLRAAATGGETCPLCGREITRGEEQSEIPQPAEIWHRIEQLDRRLEEVERGTLTPRYIRQQVHALCPLCRKIIGDIDETSGAGDLKRRIEHELDVLRLAP